jgi:Domain of unknown function (DUF4136)
LFWKRIALGLATLVAGSFVTAQVPPTSPLAKFDLPSSSTTDLSQYKSYAWNKGQVPVENLANHLRLINAVQKEMKELGYRIDTVKPDVLVQYRAERRTEVQTRSTQRPSDWDPTDLKVQIDLKKEELVDLTIELVEEESNFLVWQSKGSYPLGTPDKAERLINAAIADLFSKYPDPEQEK